MLIIALSGWAKSGKDTAAKILISDYGFSRVAFADPLKNTVAQQFDLERQSLDDQALKEAPLLDMMVEPRDPFTRMIAEFMHKEFRTKTGKQCDSFYYHYNSEDIADASFLGVMSGPDETGELVQWMEPLYWTRRALMMVEGSSKRSTNPNYWVDRAIKTARSQNKELVVISDLRYKNEIYAMKMALGNDDELVTVRINRFENSPSSDPSERDLDDAEFDLYIENRGSIDEFYKNVNEFAKKVSSRK